LVEGYGIIHHPNFDAELEGVKGSVKRGDEFVSEAIWALSRNPYCGWKGGKDVYVFQMPNTSVFIYYLIDERNPNDKKVCLLSIKKF
jgi:hypothetical protein